MLKQSDAVLNRQNEYDNFFQVTGLLDGVNGRTLRVATIWLLKPNGERAYRFITLKPAKE
jgi:hypothetical protein